MDSQENNSAAGLRNLIATLCAQQDLVFIGAVKLGPEPQFNHFSDWVDLGYHGKLHYLEKYHDLRRDPRKLLAGASSALIIGFPCYDGDRLNYRFWKHPRVAQYARYYDYHKLLKRKANKILASLRAKDPALFGRVVVDSAPLLERALACRTAQGFIGKNNMYIHPHWGSYLLLVEILVSIELDWDIPAQIDPSERSKGGGCGTCRRCEVHCPTGALKPFALDARKCISFYTIENRGVIPIEFWKYLKTYLFGCDICQLACPYNRDVPKQTLYRWEKRPSLYEIALMSQKDYEALFAGTPMTRAKRSGLRRNALVAMVVSEDPRLDSAIEQIKAEAYDPLLSATIEQIPLYLASIEKEPLASKEQ